MDNLESHLCWKNDKDGVELKIHSSIFLYINITFPGLTSLKDKHIKYNRNDKKELISRLNKFKRLTHKIE